MCAGVGALQFDPPMIFDIGQVPPLDLLPPIPLGSGGPIVVATRLRNRKGGAQGLALSHMRNSGWPDFPAAF